jgi:preprotein translocase subunit YajC
LSDGAKILYNDTMEITLSEPVTQESFDSALSAGDINVMVDEEGQNVTYALSEDGKKVIITMSEEMKTGTAVITIGGLKDLAGNSMETYTLSLEVEGADEEDDEPSTAWLIILVVLVILIIAIVLIAYFMMAKSKDEEDDSKDLPKE